MQKNIPELHIYTQFEEVSFNLELTYCKQKPLFPFILNEPKQGTSRSVMHWKTKKLDFSLRDIIKSLPLPHPY